MLAHVEQHGAEGLVTLRQTVLVHHRLVVLVGHDRVVELRAHREVHAVVRTDVGAQDRHHVGDQEGRGHDEALDDPALILEVHEVGQDQIALQEREEAEPPPQQHAAEAQGIAHVAVAHLHGGEDEQPEEDLLGVEFFVIVGHRSSVGSRDREGSALEEVDDGEQQHPDQVDEVPVETGQLQPQVVARGVLAAEGAEPGGDEPDHTNDHVQTVEAGHQ